MGEKGGRDSSLTSHRLKRAAWVAASLQKGETDASAGKPEELLRLVPAPRPEKERQTARARE